MITKQCIQCNNYFTPNKSSKQQFCSILCHNAHQHIHKNTPDAVLHKYTYTEIHCKQCGNAFSSIRQQKYCSYSCKQLYTSEYKKKNRVTHTDSFNCKCIVCTKSFKHRFLIQYCSDECKSVYKQNPSKYVSKELTCKNCESIFTPSKQNANQKFCKKSCYWEFRTKNPTIQIQSNQLNNKVKKLCIKCNKEFSVFKYRSDSALYCSRKCHYDNGREEVKCKTCGNIVVNAKHKEVQYCSIECASKGNLKRKSKLSKYIGSILYENFNNIKEEVLITSTERSIWCDFMLNDKIVIECNGDYWHCNPLFYNHNYYHSKIRKTAQEIWEYDETRKKFIESKGYIAIFIWEDEIKHNGFNETLLTQIRNIICNTQK